MLRRLHESLLNGSFVHFIRGKLVKRLMFNSISVQRSSVMLSPECKDPIFNLVVSEGCPFSLKCISALIACRAKFSISYKSGVRSPCGTYPYLLVGDIPIADSGVICDYLHSSFGGILPPGQLECALVKSFAYGAGALNGNLRNIILCDRTNLDSELTVFEDRLSYLDEVLLLTRDRSHGVGALVHCSILAFAIRVDVMRPVHDVLKCGAFPNLERAVDASLALYSGMHVEFDKFRCQFELAIDTNMRRVKEMADCAAEQEN